MSDPRGFSRTQIIIDDFGTPKSKKGDVKGDVSLSVTAVEKQVDKLVSGDEMTVDDLFEELSGGRKFVTLNDVLRWEYVKELIDGGELDQDSLGDLFNEHGGKGGKMREAR